VDVEFITQAIQMTHGRRYPSIRSPHTVTALREIARTGLLPADEAETLAGHYRFLRRVSADLRLFGARPTDTLEAAGLLPARLAKSLGYPSRRDLLEEYKRRTAWVRALYDRVVPA
jgi:glutamate-ammonia-ligase adenylyltransferase